MGGTASLGWRLLPWFSLALFSVEPLALAGLMGDACTWSAVIFKGVYLEALLSAARIPKACYGTRPFEQAGYGEVIGWTTE